MAALTVVFSRLFIIYKNIIKKEKKRKNHNPTAKVL